MATNDEDMDVVRYSLPPYRTSASFPPSRTLSSFPFIRLTAMVRLCQVEDQAEKSEEEEEE